MGYSPEKIPAQALVAPSNQDKDGSCSVCRKTQLATPWPPISVPGLMKQTFCFLLGLAFFAFSGCEQHPLPGQESGHGKSHGESHSDGGKSKEHSSNAGKELREKKG